ncbi:hypothetical protein DC522_23540 [Microvirga sp. KLBC 81]|nr:hypothetical protein DC522_23540 [Microvirga sp. KLBC 81]
MGRSGRKADEPRFATRPMLRRHEVIMTDQTQSAGALVITRDRPPPVREILGKPHLADIDRDQQDIQIRPVSGPHR